MATPTQTSTFTPPNPSAPGTPEWVYDEIMRHIEPDLLTAEIAGHPQKYRDETAEQRVARMAHYDKAFAAYDAAADAVEAEFRQEAMQVKERSKTALMKEEKQKIDDIESQIGQS
jgi:hypothetical protein